ncbi:MULTISPECIES: class II aldolase/adducin family protein [Tissierellales]|jgi:L-ribulose-5-phosphate 4-epimerase|uniref:Class II aldolase/adducin family protein n=1 Tax=Acidilutibacter cellobiosedens TaxID=2507161 RepID=A0A410QBH2_9FIRM|nr:MULTISPECIES: class II aldolase/adducin family protein [Tissierellales]MBE6082174.1 class II aldolase/adducin family protein [Tissierellaceae bacterium]QAT61307.1 class II aldolase/adducin family protein [Acidilutibacter cellobiosedens]SCL95159.1 L-fuculose phosphate aldolase [Sporanaerobacter sp. PP17-6a]
MKNKIEKAKQDVMWGVKMMVERGYSLGTAGNISARVEGEDLFVITPSSRPYNTLELNDLCLIDMKGNIVDAKFKPSVEATMHRFIYLDRIEVNDIIHSHSKYGTLVSSIENIKELPIIDVESISYLGGEVPIAPFAPAGSLELATSVKNSIGTSAGVLMENHGTIGVGITMEKALIASDNIERTSEQFLFLLATGLRKKEIPNDYVNKVREISKVNRKISTK